MVSSHSRSLSIQTPPREAASPSNPLEASLSTNQANYTLRNPLSLHAYNDSCQHLPGGNTRTVLHSTPFPLTFASGASCTLTTLDRDTYTDFLGEYTAGIYGHNHPTIYAAVHNALGKGWNFGGNNVYEKQLAKLVCERFAPTMEMVRFTNSGTEANMMALGAAMAFTERKQILVFTGAYHGSTISFPAHAMAGPSMNLPHEFVVAPYNDLAKTRAILFGLEPASLAAILVEPMLGSGGAVPGERAFLEFLRDAAAEYGALLILDEVMTSRLGYRGLGHKLGIRPDLMTLGKWVGGGMSFGAFGGRREVMAMFDPRRGALSHAGTFNNNVVSMAAGVAGCEVLDEEVMDSLNALGERMKGLVESVLREHGVVGENNAQKPTLETINGHTNPHITNETSTPPPPTHSPHTPPRMSITGIGSLLGIHFSGPNKDTLQPLFFHHMLEENIYLAPRGFIALSIEIKLNHVEHFVAALDRFVSRYKQALVD